MRIKQYISQGNVQGKGTAVHSLGGEKRTAATIPKTDQLIWQATGEVGNALIAIDKRMEEAKRVDEITNKQVQIGEEFSKLDSYMQSEEFLSTHKYDKYGEYRDEQAKAIKERIYGDLEDRKTIDAVDKMWGESNLRNKTRVKGHERKMQVEEGMADTYSNLTILKANFLRSSANADVRSADEAVQNAETLIAAKVSAGYFNKAQGFKLLNEFRESTTITMWQQNIETDPGMVKDELQKPQKNLPEDTRLQLLDQARTAYGKRRGETLTNKAYGDLMTKYGDDYEKMTTEIMDPKKHKDLDEKERSSLRQIFNNLDSDKKSKVKAKELEEKRKKEQKEEKKKAYKNKMANDLFKLDNDFDGRLDYINNMPAEFGDDKRAELKRLKADMKAAKTGNKTEPYNDAEKEIIDKITFEPGSVDINDVRDTGQNTENREKLAKKLAAAKKKGTYQKKLETGMSDFRQKAIDSEWYYSEKDKKEIDGLFYKQLEDIDEFFANNPNPTYKEVSDFKDKILTPEYAKQVINMAVNRVAVPKKPKQIQTVTTKAQYDALPSGTVYINNGKQYRKQ